MLKKGVLAGLGVLLISGLAVHKAQAQGRAYVDAYDNYFAANVITITAGTTVTWQNRGQNPHTVTADNGMFNSGIINAAGSFSYTFNNPGTYPYYCQLHGQPGGAGMAGTVVVASSASQYYPAGYGKHQPQIRKPNYYSNQPHQYSYRHYQPRQYYSPKQQMMPYYYGQISPGMGYSGYSPYGYYSGSAGYGTWY